MRLSPARRNAHLNEAHLKEADLGHSKLMEADLNRADLRGTKLWADLTKANLREADFRGAELCSPNDFPADLREADLRGANLCGADLRGVEMDIKTDLSGTKLQGAKYNTKVIQEKDAQGKLVTMEPTQWPHQGFDPDGAVDVA